MLRKAIGAIFILWGIHARNVRFTRTFDGSNRSNNIFSSGEAPV